MDALLSSELFSAVPPAMIHSLFVKFEEREVQLGETIVTEGEDGRHPVRDQTGQSHGHPR